MRTKILDGSAQRTWDMASLGKGGEIQKESKMQLSGIGCSAAPDPR